MCIVCGHYRCPPNCPENLDYNPVFTSCDNCGGKIYFGEDYYRLGDYVYCDTCVFAERRVAGD